MASANVAAYCWNDFGPDDIQKYVSAIQQSDLTTAILWSVHVGSPNHNRKKGHHWGDLIFNDDKYLFVRDQKFNPNNQPAIADWPAQVAKLRQGKNFVRKIFFSIGAGGKVYDFTTIQDMLNDGKADLLRANFQCLRDAFTPKNGACVIDGIDLDCEETVTEKTIVAFSNMLFNMGFQVTFCPAFPGKISFWKTCMRTLWHQVPQRKISWWNLQCYAGGDGNLNHLQSWLDALAEVVGKDAAPSYLLPGVGVQGSDVSAQMCPDKVCNTFAGWNKLGLGLNGGWLWRYDEIRKGNCGPRPGNLTTYVNAINNGLSNKCS